MIRYIRSQLSSCLGIFSMQSSDMHSCERRGAMIILGVFFLVSEKTKKSKYPLVANSEAYLPVHGISCFGNASALRYKKHPNFQGTTFSDTHSTRKMNVTILQSFNCGCVYQAKMQFFWPIILYCCSKTSAPFLSAIPALPGHHNSVGLHLTMPELALYSRVRPFSCRLTGLRPLNVHLRIYKWFAHGLILHQIIAKLNAKNVKNASLSGRLVPSGLIFTFQVDHSIEHSEPTLRPWA